MTLDEKHNKQLELAATFINNIAAAFIVAGFVAPVVSGQFSLGSLVWITFGTMLHYQARTLLEGLR